MWLGVDRYHGQALTLLQAPPGYDADIDETNVWLDAVDDGEAALSALLRVPYWSRQWIAQEIILSSHRTLLYGTGQMLLDEFWDAISQVPEHLGIRCQGFDDMSFLLEEYANEVVQREPHLLFESVSGFTRISLCQDPRDKVYGIQSVMQTALRLPVDYALPVRTVYLDAVVLWYEHHESDFIFAFLGDCVRLANGMALTTMEWSIDEAVDEYQNYLSSTARSDVDVRQIRWINQKEFMDFITTWVLDAHTRD
jgi:hypothetical protein